ncbi:hypothetical protein H2248_000881 [Termitomyces sp. 'cryptogamus']|nr:hypothetical protein H2248_000881 [Termitomyces sp. 'cryptogamus']
MEESDDANLASAFMFLLVNVPEQDDEDTESELKENIEEFAHYHNLPPEPLDLLPSHLTPLKFPSNTPSISPTFVDPWCPPWLTLMLPWHLTYPLQAPSLPLLFPNPDTAPSPPPQCSAKLPNPCPPSAPTLGNSNTSSADPNGSLINSDAFSAAVDAPPEFPWTPEAFPDPGTIRFPTDPIRMSPWPVPRSHLTTINSTQFRQARCHILCPPELPSIQTPHAYYDPNIPTTTPDLAPTWPRNTSRLGNPLSNPGSTPINYEASTYPTF